MGWTVAGVSNGNILHGLNCLSVTQFPTYSYYPRYFTIEVYSTATGTSQKKRIKLTDCDGDDPTCALESPGIVFTEMGTLSQDSGTKQPLQDHAIKVFDTTGRLLYEGRSMYFDPGSMPRMNNLLFCVYFDDKGRYIRTQKIAAMKAH